MNRPGNPSISLICGLVVLLISVAPAAAGKVIKISHLNPGDPLGNPTGAMTAVFKTVVEAATNGALTVQIYSDGQLGPDEEVIEQVKEGVIQSCIATAGGIAEHYPLISVLNLPFAFPNIAVVHDVLDVTSAFGRSLATDMEAETGLKVVGLLDSGGFFVITNNTRPINTLEDMADLKIRTMALPTHEAVVSALGGTPVPMPWPRLYTALQTGSVDGQMNPVAIIAFAKFDDVQTYLTLTNHLIAPYIWVFNASFYDSLSDDERYVVDFATRAAVDAGRGLARIVEASNVGLPRLARKMDINSLSAEERIRFAKAAQPAVRQVIEDKFGDRGEVLLEALLAAIDAAAATSVSGTAAPGAKAD